MQILKNVMKYYISTFCGFICYLILYIHIYTFCCNKNGGGCNKKNEKNI